MKFLVTADEYPWPARSGYRQRLHWTVRALSGLGSVDLLVARDRPLAAAEDPPPEVGLGRSTVVTAGYATRSSLSRAARWLASGRPRRLVGQDWTQVRGVAQQWATAGYDLVWFAHTPTYLALADRFPVPHVVDLDNLESSMARHRRAGRDRLSSGRSVARHLASAGADLLDEWLWRRAEREIAARAAVTVVCSDLDRARLALPRVAVLPNGYELSTRAAGSPARPTPDGGVLLFIGPLTYEPNHDAVAWFAREALPLVRARRPDACFRVVGDHDADVVDGVGEIPGVKLTGEVPDVTAELAEASVVVVPLRFGGGTRIKVIEAFAHGVPVVSTTVGCEGLNVEDGRHVLLADDPPSLAAACLRLLEDEERRTALSAQAGDLWQRRYRWTVIAPTVGQIVETALARPGSPP
ncbi:glycosyltransferase [Geodermatophilus obscurus]|uniref:Glycosyl transferase group 1 n=1 Tax=Geodermatophilus obscurus (strain ATCC 25078 / DSM 43160 / JCM 3152 / CCUG 61914 / KCC A-0152 / KCTC 9177 / NBRC 13315 / NRRL B-3577 / G-20) TaxID=526225 RepID=D2S582_GEOOG|nr:glycosyltransferase [Geodermatophilus obscurus]ADB73193.1 glycosyl transferase group 1 [Geodermatophilus obscurus DSM 43160]